MKKLIYISLAIVITSCGNSSTTDNDDTTVVDSTKVLSKEKADDEIFSEFELDSIHKKMQNSALVDFPKSWEKLTKDGKELIVFIPYYGENDRFRIEEQQDGFLLISCSLHDCEFSLITDFTIVNDEITFTLVYWNNPNFLQPEIYSTIYETRKFRYIDKEQGLIEGKLYGKKVIFTNSDYINNYKYVEDDVDPFEDQPIRIEEHPIEAVACEGADTH